MEQRRHGGARTGWSMGLALLWAAGLVLSVPAPADARETAGRVPLPAIEKGKGDQCVEDVQFMRKNHMKLLKHQRDRTVHEGIRTKQHSLNGCIECHASQKTGSVIGSNENFCQSCHSYAAVSLDCFECHASKPGVKASLTGTPQQGLPAPAASAPAASAPVASSTAGAAAGSPPKAATR